jgi:phosphoribosyl 1,2-cyclic phosphate phosphodiesterase
MKLTYLGTAAAEGFPAVFCNCEYCCEARRLKGKNIRTRSQALINDDLLIDLPADTYHHFLTNDIEADKIAYLLITHSHSDHCYVEELSMRHSPFAHNMRAPELKVVAGRGAREKIAACGDYRGNVEISAIAPYETMEIGRYTVTALPARHMLGDEALFYIIREGDQTLLYAHDTGYFYEEVFDFIAKEGVVFDLLSMDCTNVDIPIPNDGGHMGIPNIEAVVARLRDMGALAEHAQVIINHFSHNAAPLHHLLEARVAPLSYLVSYDGMSVEI